MIMIKSAKEIEAMRASGRLAARILREVSLSVAPGVRTGELAELAGRLLRDAGAQSAFLGYRGYPGIICVSVNEEVVHGIPGERLIKTGDIVSIDIGVRYEGYIGDTATTVMVGVSDPDVIRLVETARSALETGLALCRDGVRLGAVSHAIEQTACARGCVVVRDFVGHGVGKKLHEDPQVPNYGKPGSGPVLKTGMTLCVEPMVNQFSTDVKVMPDGWTAVTRDGGFSAHFEHMIAIGDEGAEILSRES